MRPETSASRSEAPLAGPTVKHEPHRDDPACGRAALEQLAPEAGVALHRLEVAAWRSMAEADEADLFDLATRVVAGLHGLAPLARPADLGESPWSRIDASAWRKRPELSEAQRVALGFAEQMSFDVASLGDSERGAFFEALGARAPFFAQAVYGADLIPRVRGALDVLFGETGDWSGSQPGPDVELDLGGAIDELIRVVPALQALDPVTTELVRLLGARRHRCRVCQALRSRSAMVAGADDSTFDAVDRYATSGLPQSQKVALAFTDSLIGAPGRIETDAAIRLRAHFEPAACVELVLDIARNAANKVAVALAADAPRVASGYEIYDVTPEGELLYGLEAP